MDILKKTLILLVATLFLAISCKKEEENHPPSKPRLLNPPSGAVVGPEQITFQWEKSTDTDGEDVYHSLALSSDSVNWQPFVVGLENSKTIVNKQGESSYYLFENGKKYYWKVIAESHDENDKITGTSESNVVGFYTMPNGVANLTKTSGNGFVNLAWIDPVGLTKIEVTFSPTVIGIVQPIVVNPGVSKVELQGMQNETLYNFYVKAYNSLGHSSKVDTIKALPLSPTLIHDNEFNIYSTVQIGTQTWMRENLRATKWQNGQEMKNSNYKFYRISSQSNIYGYYYYSDAAINEIQGNNPCPCGYHVPTDDEWMTLERFLGMPEEEVVAFSNFPTRGANLEIGNLLKSSSGWNENGNGSDLYAFKILPAGFYDVALSFRYIGDYADVWTSTKLDGYNLSRRFGYQHKGIRRERFDYNHGASIRCVKD